MKHLLSIYDIKDEIHNYLDLAQKMKRDTKRGIYRTPLKNKSLAMIFEKASTRTRVSFEVAMTQLGGHALFLTYNDLQIGRGETIADTARVLSRYVDGIMYRAFSHAQMKELARHSSVPVINGLDDVEHPCQILADLLTIKEKKGGFKGRKLAYVGDGNNVCHSLILGCAAVGMRIAVATPRGYEPDGNIVDRAEHYSKESIDITHNPKDAVVDADVLYTDVWVSMGNENEAEIRKQKFSSYQINSALLSHAKKDAIVMHCLPAHRGLEITDEVMDGKQSVVFDQAENRLHVQKAVLVKLIR